MFWSWKIIYIIDPQQYMNNAAISGDTPILHIIEL